MLFNEGYWSSADDAPIRADLCRLAIGLARSLVETFSNVPEAAGLLALLILHDARRDARIDEQGNPVALPDQDRARWDHEAIRRATELLDRTLGARAPGPLQTEAAIAVVHCQARTAEETNWPEIASLFFSKDFARRPRCESIVRSRSAKPKARARDFSFFPDRIST
jgi:RNA polymerase sigma-70 factor, ECF subfamily